MSASRASRLGTILFYTLLAVALAVTVVVVRARTPDLVLEVVQLAPRELRLDDEGDRPVRISFFVREDEPAADVAIVNWTGRVVRTLDEAVPLAAGEPVSYTWGGRGDGGRRVIAGSYRLRVDLPRSGRQMVWPRRISVQRPASELRPAPEARP